MAADLTRFNGKMKMAELVESDCNLLAVLSRMGIGGSLGEKTVDEICRRNGLDTATFVLICEVYSNKGFRPAGEELSRARIGDVLRYLHKSHDYYMDEALVALASSVERLIEPCPAHLQKVIWSFFSDYKHRLEAHFDFEERQVIPYIRGLVSGNRAPGCGIDGFEEDHPHIEESLSDLRSIILRSLPSVCDNMLQTSLLMSIYALRDDLDRHTWIEEVVLMPMVRLLENPDVRPSQALPQEEMREEGRGELSGREKEILVSVALGLLNKEIADKHNISINTVITHRKNITRKTGIKTVAGLTVYAILNNLLDIKALE